MDLLYFIVVAIVLAIDAFVISISCGMAHTRSNLSFCTKVSLFFGIAQGSFFVIGYFLGSGVDILTSEIDHWIAFFLLAFVGMRMVLESIKGWKKERECRIIGTKTLIVLSFATSIDAFAIGMTFGILNDPFLAPMIIIGAVTFVLSFIGVLIGDGLSGRFGKVAEIVGGLVLIGLGIKILLEHLVK